MKEEGSTVKIKCEGCGKDYVYQAVNFEGICTNEGWVRYCEECSEKAQKADERAEQQDLLNACLAMLPLRYDAHKATQRHKSIIEYVGKTVFKDKKLQPVSVFLHGVTGAGKTTSLVYLCQVLAKRGHPFKYYKAKDIQAAYSRSLSIDGRKEVGYMIDSAIESRCVVVIDDWLKGEWTKRTEEFWLKLFEYRLEKGLPTWLTCNYPSAKRSLLSKVKEKMTDDMEASCLVRRIYDLFMLDGKSTFIDTETT